MQGTTVGRHGRRRRGAVAAAALGLALALSGCGPFSADRTSAASSPSTQDIQTPSDATTGTDTGTPATGPIPTVTAEPLTPTTPTASPSTAPASGPTTTTAPPAVTPTDTPATVTPVTAPAAPTGTDVPGTAPGQCARTLTAYPVLQPGAEGPAVRALECFLNDDRYGPVTVDGVYGAETRAAVRRVEATLEGPPPHPGRIDAGMWVLVISRALGNDTLQLGSTGPSVVTLQRALRAAGATVAVDGRFGAQTKKAVQRLQEANRVGADGIVKDETLFLLKSGATIG